MDITSHTASQTQLAPHQPSSKRTAIEDVDNKELHKPLTQAAYTHRKHPKDIMRKSYNQ